MQWHYYSKQYICSIYEVHSTSDGRELGKPSLSLRHAPNWFANLNPNRFVNQNGPGTLWHRSGSQNPRGSKISSYLQRIFLYLPSQVGENWPGGVGVWVCLSYRLSQTKCPQKSAFWKHIRSRMNPLWPKGIQLATHLPKMLPPCPMSYVQIGFQESKLWNLKQGAPGKCSLGWYQVWIQECIDQTTHC